MKENEGDSTWMYGSITTLIDQYGFFELQALAPAESGEGMDETRITEALERASSEADSYLSPRYALPLPTVPRVLVHFVGVMALYQLTGGEAVETTPITRRYQEALDWLRGVAAGKINLPGLPLAGEGTGGGVVFEPGKRDW